MDRIASRIRLGMIAVLCGALLAPAASLAAGAGAASKTAPATIPQKPSAKADDAGKGAPAGAMQPSGTQQAFGDWSLQCLNDRTVEPRCQIIHRLMSPDGKQVMLVLSMAPISKDRMGLQLALPLGFSIQSGVKLSFGGDFSTTAAVSRCTIQGCLVEGACPPKMLAAMKKAKDGKVSVETMQGNPIRLDLGLDGFSAAYEAMQKGNGAAG